MLEAVLKAGHHAGFATVEAFAEKVQRRECDVSVPSLSFHDARSDRLRLRAFRDTGDPLGASLSAPDLRQVRHCFAELASGAALDRKGNFAHELPKAVGKVKVNIYDAGIETWDEAQAADVRERIRESLLSFPGLKLRKCLFSRTLRKVYLANTRGFFAKYRKTLFQVQASFMLGECSLELNECRPHFRDLDPGRLALRGANLLGALAAGAESPAIQGEAIVMSPEASAQVLREFSPWLKRDHAVARGHTAAAAARVSILDSPLLDGEPGSAPFDDEGTAAAENYLVNKGVAVAAAADIRTAFAIGGTTTGNGFRDERGIFPQVQFSNLFIKPSNDPLVRLLQQARDGVLVSLVRPKETGGHAGERLFSAYGYAIVNNEVARPVHFHFATSMRSFMLHIQGVSRELRFFPGRANIGSPYLLLQGRPTPAGAGKFFLI
ncbi:MAG: metallopeptidase TldD-related protein [Acidobacteria bacterium]|jgi:predicted Zn-dependent protease|nr:metallopeptidase TldD-related protein [Acidobacteriota bacterium]